MKQCDFKCDDSYMDIKADWHGWGSPEGRQGPGVRPCTEWEVLCARLPLGGGLCDGVADNRRRDGAEAEEAAMPPQRGAQVKQHFTQFWRKRTFY